MSSKNKKLLTALGVAAVVVIVIAAVLLGKGGQTTTVDPASTPSDVSAEDVDKPVQRTVPVSASCRIPPGRYFSAVVGAVCHTHFFFRCEAKGTAEAGNRGNGRLCSFRRGCGTAILHQDLG